MTDRHHGYIVVLEQDLRSDDAEATLNAIRQIKGVISVEPVVTEVADHMARARVRDEMAHSIWKVLYPKKPT